MTNMISVIEKAQSRMLFKHLFFATVILGTPTVETRKFPRAATNMKVIFYNPDFIQTLTLPVVMFVIAHEVMHIILKHGFRRQGREPALWNRACDFVINARLKEAGFTLWADCCYDPKYDGMFEEQVYNLLVQEQEQKQKQKQKQKPEPEPEPEEGEGEPEEGEGEPEEGEGEPEEGEGEPERESNDPLKGDLTDFEMPTDPTERAKLSREIDQRVAQAVNMARQAGQMPAGLGLLMDGILNPPLPWFSIFHDYMLRFCVEEESWSRRNRRIHQYVLPSRRNPGMGGIGLIGDTSGSMLEYKVYPQIGEEINHMMLVAHPEFVQVIWADDTEAALEERFEAGDFVTLHPTGGGGTDMRKPLKRMADHGVDICVLVTDTETPWPDEPTPFPLIVLTTTNGAVPAWATVIRIR